jgi:hypothetical protein
MLVVCIYIFIVFLFFFKLFLGLFFCSAWSPFWVSLAVSDPSDFSPYLQGMTLLKTLVSVVGGGPWKNLQPLNLK